MNYAGDNFAIHDCKGFLIKAKHMKYTDNYNFQNVYPSE